MGFSQGGTVSSLVECCNLGSAGVYQQKKTREAKELIIYFPTPVHNIMPPEQAPFGEIQHKDFPIVLHVGDVPQCSLVLLDLIVRHTLLRDIWEYFCADVILS